MGNWREELARLADNGTYLQAKLSQHSIVPERMPRLNPDEYLAAQMNLAKTIAVKAWSEEYLETYNSLGPMIENVANKIVEHSFLGDRSENDENFYRALTAAFELVERVMNTEKRKQEGRFL